MKTPERTSRMRTMKRPSTVVFIQLINVHTTPSNGRMPSTRERASIMDSTLPPVIFCSVIVRFGFGGFLFGFAPELVSGAANEDIFQRGLADRESFDLSREGFDDVGNK